MSNGGPTPAQIQQVQSNLKNMQAFNDYVYDTGAVAKVLNAYMLLSEQDSSDPGLTIVLNILEGAFWAIGSEFGEVGNFAASFLSGMLSWWTTNTPSSLGGTFSSMLTRLQATKIQVDQTLAEYYQNVAGNWSTQFTYNGHTATLSDFASVNFPAETDPTFETMATRAIFAMDQLIWRTVLKAKFVVTLWESSSSRTPMQGDQNDPPVSWDEAFIAKNPAYYTTWTWHNSAGCGDISGWIINEYNLGTGAGPFFDGSISGDACRYLFIDSADGVVINEAALYPRATVFNHLGIRQTTYYVFSAGGPTAAKLSTAYLRAMKAGNTLGNLIEREGREAIQNRIIAKALQDPVFADDLKFRPRETIEKFLGVKIPEVVGISVIVETPRNFGLVVPMIETK